MESHIQVRKKINGQIGNEGNGMELWGYSLSFWETTFRWATGIAAVAGGIGVTAAFISAIVGYQVTDRVIKESDKKIAEANTRAEEAKAEAIKARLELVKFKSPRSLNSEQIVSISEKLRKFSGTKFDFGIGPAGDPEPEFLFVKIEEALAKAGWIEIAWKSSDPNGFVVTRPGKVNGGAASVTNVIVEYPAREKMLEDAAVGLSDALNSEGVDTKAKAADGLGSARTNINPSTIHLMIGRKL